MSDVGTVTLAEFLLARIAEDEARARFPSAEVAARAAGILAAEAQDVRLAHPPQPGYAGALEEGARVLNHHDPARVLAECEAKRRIVEGMQTGWIDDMFAPEILALLALPFADHPDYDESWKP